MYSLATDHTSAIGTAAKPFNYLDRYVCGRCRKCNRTVQRMEIGGNPHAWLCGGDERDFINPLPAVVMQS